MMSLLSPSTNSSASATPSTGIFTARRNGPMSTPGAGPARPRKPPGGKPSRRASSTASRSARTSRRRSTTSRRKKASPASSGENAGVTRSTGGWFSYDLKVLPDKPMVLLAKYWGSDTGRTFDILIDGARIATQTVNVNFPGDFFEVEYKIPSRADPGEREGHGQISGPSRRRGGRAVRLGRAQGKVIKWNSLRLSKRRRITCSDTGG